MDLRKRLTSLIQKKDSKGDDLSNDFTSGPAIAKFKHINEMPMDPQIDREIMDSIDKTYFQGDNFDASQFELEKLTEKPHLEDIDDKRTQLRRQLQSVCKKVSDVVLENHSSYALELQRVMELQRTLQDAKAICSNGRGQLTGAQQGFTSTSLGLLANYKKRQRLLALLDSLHTIKTLQQTDIRLREMLEEEDYPGAIQLCLECQKAASTFRHYKCISELNSKLQDTLEMIEEQLDVALSKVCNGFDQKHYEKVQAAYRLLGKTQTAMDQLHMHYTSAIHNNAFTIVLGYVELLAGTESTNFQKRQYADLCKNISAETFTTCLIDLCKALWEVMKSYYQTMHWHEKYDQETFELDAADPSVEATFNRRYVKQKLEHGLGRIWQDVQQKVKVFILNTDLSYFKYDEFIQVLDIGNRLIQIGEEFCNSKSEALQESLRKQTINYFRNFHRAKLEELRMFLENEGWELCPVKVNFSITQLHEFRFLRNTKKVKLKDRQQQSDMSSNHSGSSSQSGYFDRYLHGGDPFHSQADDDDREDVLATNGYEDSDSDSDIPEELKQEYIDEGGSLPNKRDHRKDKNSNKSRDKAAPIITNTTLNVLRLFGKYMQIMSVLKPIAFDVILCMSQLFDFYLFAVHSFFNCDQMNDSMLSDKLRTTLQRIEDNLIGDNSELGNDNNDRIQQPYLSPVIDLSRSDSLYGLTEKIIAVESLVFLANQFSELETHLEEVIPVPKKAFLKQFYSQTISTAHELRYPVYESVASMVLGFDSIVSHMASVKWDIRELLSQHSPYVDIVLRDFQKFSNCLSEIGSRVPIPNPVFDILWDHSIRLATRQFVEGYSLVKKCTNEGRALMQLDFQQFLMKLEKLTNIRPIPGREYVEVYIKAYYLPDTQLELWIREHKEYSSKQVISLLNCHQHLNKKSRQKLIAMMDDPLIKK